MAVDTFYIDDDYIEDGHFQRGIEIVWGQRRIIIPRLALDLVQTVPSVVYNLDLNEFRNTLKDLEDSEEGMPFPQTHRHNTTVTLSGITFARVIEIINDYTVEFEDGQYAVNLVGANSNVADRVIVNQVSVRAANSAGLIEVATSGGSSLTPAQIWSHASRTLTTPIPTPPSTEQIVAAVLAALQATTIPVDAKKMNGANVIGDGSEADPWRGEGVLP